MTTRLLEATGSFPPGNGGEVVFPFLAADLQMIGQKGSLVLLAFEISGDGGAEITVKKAYVRMTKDPDQGRHVGLKSTAGWKIARINKFCGPEALRPPAWKRYEVLDGYELVLEGDNANAGALALVLEAVIENHTGNVGKPGPQALPPGLPQALPPGIFPSGTAPAGFTVGPAVRFPLVPGGGSSEPHGILTPMGAVRGSGLG